MTKKELLVRFERVPDNAEIFMYSDEKGNHILPLNLVEEDTVDGKEVVYLIPEHG